MNCVYLALGSNLGAREEHLRAGIRGLANRGIDIVRCASVYSTEPRDVLDQPWFLNTALEAVTRLGSDELLLSCLEIEKENGRTCDRSKGPRTLDIDIIFYGNEIIRKPELNIPHPHFSSRRFVLVPLAEIAPGFIDPLSGSTVQELLERCDDPSSIQVTSIRLGLL
jgi:2-amino-4-hydroxy-6-hydroxymethyldihydropteridine diphosphokinase